MTDAREAIGHVADRLGDDATRDDLGRLVVTVEEVFTIVLAPAADGLVRLSAPLEDLPLPLTRPRLEALLEANALGAGTGPAALAIAEDGRPTLLELVDCTRLSPDDVIQKVADFAQLAAWWQTIGSDRLLARTATVAARVRPAAEHIIAV